MPIFNQLFFILVLFYSALCHGEHINQYVKSNPSNHDKIFKLRDIAWHPKKINSKKMALLTDKETALIVSQQGYTSRHDYEKVYRAKKNILEKVNSVLPGLDIGISLSGAPISLSSQLIGFLLPSNWFSLNGSKKYYTAEKSSYQNLMLEEYLLTQNVYYELHRLLRAYYLKTNFKLWLSKFLDKFKSDLNTNKYNLDELTWTTQRDSLRQLKLFLVDFFSDIYDIREEFNESIELLSLSMGLQKKSVVIVPLNLNQYSTYDSFPKKSTVTSRSYHLKSLYYYRKYLKYKKRSHLFNTFTGKSQEISFHLTSGFDTYAIYQKDISAIREVDIEYDEAKEKLERSITILTEQFKILQEKLASFDGSGHRYKKVLLYHINNYKKTGILDYSAFRRSIKWAVGIELKRDHTLHTLAKVYAELKRLEIGKEFNFVKTIRKSFIKAKYKKNYFFRF